MNLRILSGAFIIDGSNYLMMKRALTKKIAPGMWGGVGGHAEPTELNSPKTTCLREIYEETGIEEKAFKSLDLKYVIARRNKDELTLIYYFIGFSKTKHFEDKTQEGKLFWVNESEILDRPMSFEVRNMVEHYLAIGSKNNLINVGAVSLIDDKPTMIWTTLDSWEGLVG